ncbi:MAG: hypothetical protein K8S99_17650 [Planctomycetes bacterium]|nr:hypothetical protein [Planctomycetota bacterium]
MEEQQGSTGVMDQWRSGMSCIVFFARSLAVSVEVFLRRGFGERYIGLQAAVAMPIILFFGVFFPEDDPGPMLWFLLAYLVMCVRARIDGFRRRRRGELRSHSFYNGWPRLARVNPKFTESQVKRKTEPLLVLAVGYLVWQLNRPLGMYLILSAAALFLVAVLTERYERARAMDMNDAVIEQHRLAERFRELNDDW